MSTDSRAQGHFNFDPSDERKEAHAENLTELRALGVDTSSLPHEFNFGLSVAGFNDVLKSDLGYWFTERPASEGTHQVEIDEGKYTSLYHLKRDTEKIIEIAEREGATVNGQIVRWDENNNTEVVIVKDNVLTHRVGKLVAKFDDIEIEIE